MTIKERNDLLDEVKRAVWKALDPSQEGTIRECWEQAATAIDKFKLPDDPSS